MKKILRTLKAKLVSLFNKITRSRVLSSLVVLVVGLAIGIALGKTVFVTESKTTTTQSPFTKSSRSSSDTVDEKTRLETAYKDAQKRIDEASKDGKLTEDQAKLLSDKATEIYNYRKDIDATTEKGRDELRAKRKEWRNWVKERKLSSIYLVRLYL